MTSKEALKELSYLQQAAAKDNTLILEALDTIKEDLEVLEILNKYLVSEDDGYMELNGLCVPCKSIELYEFRNISNDYDNVRDYLEKNRKGVSVANNRR